MGLYALLGPITLGETLRPHDLHSQKHYMQCFHVLKARISSAVKEIGREGDASDCSWWRFILAVGIYDFYLEEWMPGFLWTYGSLSSSWRKAFHSSFMFCVPKSLMCHWKLKTESTVFFLIPSLWSSRLSVPQTRPHFLLSPRFPHIAPFHPESFSVWWNPHPFLRPLPVLLPPWNLPR